MDSEQLAEVMGFLREQNGFTIHSLLIIRDGERQTIVAILEERPQRR